MKEHRYLEHAQQFDSELMADMRAHREAAATDEKQAHGHDGDCGLDAIAKGKTPLEQVKAVLEHKRSAGHVLKEHEVGKKMAQMAGRPQRLVEAFLGDKG